MNPAYEFDELKVACNDSEKVFVWKPALTDASTHFGLTKMGDVLDFVANDGLEKKKFINSKPFELAPDPKPLVDAYEFYSDSKRGYFAFFFQPLTKKWNIKSFKLHEDGDDRFYLFANLGQFLSKADES